MNKQINTTLAIAVIILIAGALGILIWFGVNNQKQSQTTVRKDSEALANAEKIKNQIYDELQDKFKINDYTKNLKPTEGYIVLSSIFSNNKDRVVYFERSLSNYDYKIVVMNLDTNRKNILYFYKSGVSQSNGACPFEYFPVAWSKNNKKIIVEWGNTTGSGSGCVPKYASYTIDINGGNLVALATDEAVFLDSNLEVVYTDSSEKSPSFCEHGGTENHGSIKIKNIETSEEKSIIEEENSYYNISEVNNNSLTYTVERVFEISGDDWPAGCSQFDKSYPKSEKIIKIK
ncbi:MAG: hypothetical protein WCK16_04580 [Candidatus Moraniibacteriota bacterium]